MPAGKPRKIALRRTARADLAGIWRYTADNWSPEQADKYVRILTGAMDALASGDKVGRVCAVRDSYLQYGAGSHIIFYRLTDDMLDVARVLHQRMDVGRHI